MDADLAEGRRRGVTGSPHFIVDGTPFFCPGLDVERQGEHLHIDIGDAELHRTARSSDVTGPHRRTARR